MTTYNQIQVGKIIIAEPFMLDPHFRRSVVVVTEHREEGTMGFIMNKKLDARLNEVVSDFPDFDAPLYYGGPLANNTIHYLHNVGELLEGSTRVSSGVYSGGNWQNLKPVPVCISISRKTICGSVCWINATASSTEAAIPAMVNCGQNSATRLFRKLRLCNSSSIITAFIITHVLKFVRYFYFNSCSGIIFVHILETALITSEFFLRMPFSSITQSKYSNWLSKVFRC